MYKAGLVLTLLAQIVMTLVMVILAASADTIFGLGDNLTQAGLNQIGEALNSTLSTGASIYIGVFASLAVMYIISVVVTSLALSNLSKVENGTASLSSGLAIAAGVLGLFTTILGGIFILVGKSEVTNNYSQNREQPRTDNRRR